MHGSNVQASVIADTMTIIAICTGSRTVLELAIALRAITTGKLGVPPRPENAEMVRRIARNLLDPQWNARTRAALGDSKIEQLARHFFDACVSCVPTSAPDPLSDETWLMGVRALYSKEQSMQLIAEALMNQFAPLSHDEPTAQAPAQPAAPVVAATPISTPPAPSPAEVQAKLIVRLRLIARAWRFVHQFARNWKAQQERKAAAQSPEPIPAPATSSAQETNSTRAPAVAPMPTHAPAPTPNLTLLRMTLQPAPRPANAMYGKVPPRAPARLHAVRVPVHSPWFTGIAGPTSAPIYAMVLPSDRHVSRRFVGPVTVQGRFVNAQREACGLSPP